MKVSEVFYSIQGEGQSIGCPALFIRLGECNLRCPWCDTLEVFTKFEDISIEVLFKKVIDILELQRHNTNRIILTGGEPLLQQNELSDFLALLKKEKNTINEIETNGTIKPESHLLPYIQTWNVSPKLFLKEQMHLKYDMVYKFFAEFYAANFKFVVSDLDEFKLMVKFIEKYKIPEYKVYVMPNALVRESLYSDFVLNLVEKVKEFGYNFTTRLQILLWNDKKGV